MRLLELAFSPFDGALFVLSAGDGGWRLERYPRAEDGRLDPPIELLRSSEELRNLVAPLLRWDGQARLFVGRKVGAGFQVLSLRVDGSGLYAVTSPSNLDAPPPALGDAGQQPPWRALASSALPLSLHPVSGRLLYQDGARQMEALAYLNNRVPDEPVPGAVPGTLLIDHPNGWYRLRWTTERTGVVLLHPDGREAGWAGTGSRFAAPPLVSPDGRTLVGAVRAGGGVRLVTAGINVSLAGVRFLVQVAPDDDRWSRLARDGVAFEETSAAQIWQRLGGAAPGPLRP